LVVFGLPRWVALYGKSPTSPVTSRAKRTQGRNNLVQGKPLTPIRGARSHTCSRRLREGNPQKYS